MNIDEITDEALSKEGDGLLLRAYETCVVNRERIANKIAEYSESMRAFSDRLKRIENALGKKYPKGANLIYSGALIQVAESRFSSNEMTVTSHAIKVVH